jgi:hypothetical protein
VHGDDRRAYEVIEPALDAALQRMPTDRFSTKRFIEELRATEAGEAAYQEALASLVDDPSGEHMGKMVLHGQVIPGLLRSSGLVRFGGFIHGNPAEDDGFGIPSLWQKR